MSGEKRVIATSAYERVVLDGEIVVNEIMQESDRVMMRGPNRILEVVLHPEAMRLLQMHCLEMAKYMPVTDRVTDSLRLHASCGPIKVVADSRIGETQALVYSSDGRSGNNCHIINIGIKEKTPRPHRKDAARGFLDEEFLKTLEDPFDTKRIMGVFDELVEGLKAPEEKKKPKEESFIDMLKKIPDQP